MDINFLFDYINPIILGICLMVGFVLKTAFDKFPNKYIPLSALCMGTIIAILINLQSGMISGLASTGLYELLRNMLNKDGKKDEGE
jgi:xanthine/uracil permease